jgi:hypothetical protein
VSPTILIAVLINVMELIAGALNMKSRESK